MTTVSGHDRVIVTVDLRDTDPATLTGRRFAEVQAERVPGGDPRRVDFSRVILVDDTAALARNHEVYAHILDSHVDVSIVCLAVGQGPGDDATVALRRPFQLGPPKAATLWIGDVHGIGWQMESTQADYVHFPGDDQGGAAVRTPWALTEILSLPQIFDRVVEAVGHMPGAAACPGTRVVRSETDPDVLADAQIAAIRRLTEPGNGTADADLASLTIPRVQPGGPGQPQGHVGDVIQPGGEVDRMYQRCRRAAHDATASARRVADPRWLLSGDGGSVRGAFSRLADALADFSATIDQTLDWADPRTGFNSGHLDQLEHLGISISRSQSVRSGRTVDALREFALKALDRQRSLPRVADLLRDMSDQAVPQGTETYRDRLAVICPGSGLRRLRRPPALLAAAGSPVLLAATFAVGLLAGLWPVPGAVCAVIAVLGVAGAAIWTAARAAAITGPDGRGTWRFVLSQLAVGIAGAGAGVALTRLITLPVPAAPSGAVLGTVLTLVFAVILAMLWWLVAAGRWTSALRVAQLAKATDGIRALVAETAREEWQRAEDRGATSDYARVLAGIVEDIAAGLQAHAADLPGPGARGPSGPVRPPKHHQVVHDLVVIDICDAVADVLSRLSTMLGSSSLVSVDGATVRRELTAILLLYDAHLATVGLQEPPPFGRESQQRPLLVKSLMERATDLQELMRSGVQDGHIIQLCAPEQLTLLETDPASAELIRFAPQAAQESVTTPFAVRPGRMARDHPVDWTVASSMAGLLRLVPLRASAVQEVWPASERLLNGSATDHYPGFPDDGDWTDVVAGDEWQSPATGQDGAAGE